MIPDLESSYTCNARAPPPATMVTVAGGGWNRRKSQKRRQGLAWLDSRDKEEEWQRLWS